MKKTCLILLMLTCMTCGWAKSRDVVWNNPAFEYSNVCGDGYYDLFLDVTKVVMKEGETLVHITAHEAYKYHSWFQFSKDTYLRVGEKRYPAVSADGFKFDKKLYTNEGDSLDMVFHFAPLPENTKSFDFIEGDFEGAFQIRGINSNDTPNSLFPTYWRDDKTGDWTLALFDKWAIYQCRFWDYKQCDVNKKGEAEITMRNGDEELKVSVGKNKSGKRVICIGDKKATYSMITERRLPDYPIPDTREGIIDNGYKPDSVTIVGWLNDLPENYENNKTFDFAYSDPLQTYDDQFFYANMDEQGRFSIKIPVLNSTEFVCDWRRSNIPTVFEPGKTYFLLCDRKTGRRMFMGDDVRLQNELLKYNSASGPTFMEENADFDTYFASIEKSVKTNDSYINQSFMEHPLLSIRCKNYLKSNRLWDLACGFVQSRYHLPKFMLPDSASKFIYDNFWTKLRVPYTLHGAILTFLSTYLDDTYSKNYSNSDAIKFEKLFQEKADYGECLVSVLKEHNHILDSLNASQPIKDYHLCNMIYMEIYNYRKSLPSFVIDTLKAMTTNPYLIERVEDLNNHYIALENRDLDKHVLKSSDILAGMTDGEAMMKKILEPYRGKFVLLDIWGTWCGPCKQALSHSAEEFERLAPYNVEFLYLAKESPQDSWKNVIKEYNVTGENVVHYNLPANQQSAIEQYLKVQHYPTYKLFDREGNLLDADVDPRDFGMTSGLDKLEELLKCLSTK